MSFDYTIMRSCRRTLSMEVRPEGSVLVRSPVNMPVAEIDAFVKKHSGWAEKHIAAALAHKKRPEPTAEQESVLRELAAVMLPERTAYFSERMGLQPSGIKITGARTRFGSCGPKNSICFSWRLMLYPPEARDYVVVHELAHILHKNHGRDFYSLIGSVLPDYKERRKLLRD